MWHPWLRITGTTVLGIVMLTLGGLATAEEKQAQDSSSKASGTMGEGAPTPEGSVRAEAIASTPSGGRTVEAPASTRRQSFKARVLDPAELRPGLWVDVEFRKTDEQNQARRITVMRPVGGADTPTVKSKASSPGH
jgi:hypothetical protein